jgi:hypothetical protein
MRMVTQTFQDIVGHGPLHWRGDRRSLEAFNPTFTDLLGRDTELTGAQMESFKDVLRSIHIPPNPFRNLDDTMPESVPFPGLYGLEEPDEPLVSGDPRRGFDMLFFNSGGDNQCRSCHERSTGLTPDGNVLTGPDGEAHFGLRADERTFRLPFKVPQLRNLHEKLGLDYDRNSSRTGFGFTHDGRMDTFLRLADSPSNRLDLIVRGEKDGLSRGWYFAGHFISDRRGEDLTAEALRALASPSNPLTFTLVPRGLKTLGSTGIARTVHFSAGRRSWSEIPFRTGPKNISGCDWRQR